MKQEDFSEAEQAILSEGLHVECELSYLRDHPEVARLTVNLFPLPANAALINELMDVIQTAVGEHLTAAGICDGRVTELFNPGPTH